MQCQKITYFTIITGLTLRISWTSSCCFDSFGFWNSSCERLVVSKALFSYKIGMVKFLFFFHLENINKIIHIINIITIIIFFITVGLRHYRPCVAGIVSPCATGIVSPWAAGIESPWAAGIKSPWAENIVSPWAVGTESLCLNVTMILAA